MLDHQWIALSDGTRLHARIWLPDDALSDPVPAILEASPYRLTDAGQRDWEVYPYWAGYGYACARVDLRGTGDSEGLIVDEYTAWSSATSARSSPGSPPGPGAAATSA